MLDQVERVSGSHDFRMLPVAAACWAGCLLGRWFFNEHKINGFAAIFTYASVIFILLAIMRILLKSFSENVKHCAHKRNTILFDFANFTRHKLFDYNRTISLIICVCLSALMLSYITQCVISEDSVMRGIYAQNESQTKYSKPYSPQFEHIAEVTIISPPRVSQSFRADCQTMVQINKFAGEKSYVQARMYAYNPVCNQLKYGSSVQLPVSVKASHFDKDAPELQVEKSYKKVKIIKNAGILQQVVNKTWKSFYEVTNNLDMQGSILVPGVTVGMVGQEYVPTEAGNTSAAATTADNSSASSDDSNSANSKNKYSHEPIDETYATMMRKNFQHSGIMHVMAVSGGHFLLLNAIVRRCCSYFLMPRWITSTAQIIFYIALASIVYPSSSVLRALVMGIISAVAWVSKRPYQSASALSWTVVAVLLVNPSYAWDYAFALSCAATLGIIVMGVPLQQVFSQYLPSWISSALAITLSAQCWTMPVQILIQPEVSFMSVPANLIVAPLMDWATICGLISLIFACFNNEISLIFAQLASIGTDLMQQCAYWCDEASFGVFPWLKGVQGAWLMFGVEVSIFVLFIFAFRVFRNRACVQRAGIAGRLWGAYFKRMIIEASQIFDYKN